MQVIEDYTKIKETVDQNYEYTGVGFTKSNLFNLTHDHLYDHSKLTVNENRKLFGMVWDNKYDIEIFLERESSPSVCNKEEITEWFDQRGFSYLFIPNSDFIHNILKDSVYQECLKETKKIWNKENYKRLMGNYNIFNAEKWMHLILSRHYFLFSGMIMEKVLNRTCQLFSPEGTWGYIYKHFMESYCSCNSPMVPMIRKENGLTYDHLVETTYPEEVKIMFEELVPFIGEFREDHDSEKLKQAIQSKVYKPKEPNYFLDNLEIFNDPLTFNKYIIRIVINRNFKMDNGQYIQYRFWDYDNGI